MLLLRGANSLIITPLHPYSCYCRSLTLTNSRSRRKSTMNGIDSDRQVVLAHHCSALTITMMYCDKKQRARARAGFANVLTHTHTQMYRQIEARPSVRCLKVRCSLPCQHAHTHTQTDKQTRATEMKKNVYDGGIPPASQRPLYRIRQQRPSALLRSLHIF